MRVSSENIVLESDGLGNVVNANVEVSLLAGVQAELFNIGSGVVVRSLKGRDELKHLGELDSIVDLAELLEESSKNNRVEGLDILGHLWVDGNLGEDRLDLGADRERVELNLKNVVELPELGTGPPENVTVERLLEQTSTSGSARKAEEGGEPASTASGLLVTLEEVRLALVHVTGTGGVGGNDGDSESTDENVRGHAGALLLGLGTATGKGVETVPCSGVEKVVVRDHENTGKLLVVVCHHGGARSLLSHGEKVVDILDAAESLLPKLELDSAVELGKASVEVALESVLVSEVDSVSVVGVASDVLKVLTEDLAEPSELGLSLVLKAELESLVGNLLVGDLETGVVPENVEGSPVSLPEELEPGSDKDAVGTVLVLVSADTSEEHALGAL